MVKLKLLATVFLCIALTACSWFRNHSKDISALPVEAIYTKAKAALTNEHYEQAIKLYQELEARYPYGRYAKQAQLELAYAYYKNDNGDLASATADRFLREHPTDEQVDYAYYLKGLASFREHAGFFARLGGTDDLHDRDPTDARNAFDAFRELVTRFPDSQYSADTRLRMAHLLNVLARHDVAVARYYMTRGAWVAAVNRSTYVVEHYQGAPAVEDALGLMTIAYRSMGLNDLAEDTLRVLRTNFPQSRYLQALNG